MNLKWVSLITGMKSLTSKKTALNIRLNSLQAKRLEISSEINQQAKTKEYQANLDNMSLLLNSAQQRISAIILPSQPEIRLEESAFLVPSDEAKDLCNPEPFNEPEAILNLYLKIRKLGELSDTVRISDPKDAEEIKELGVTLERQLNDLCKNRPKSRKYIEFKKIFVDTIKAHAPVMSKYDNLWKPILVNLIIGLFSLGIALGIKALHSKATTGRYSLFYAETDREKVIGELEQSLKIIC